MIPDIGFLSPGTGWFVGALIKVTVLLMAAALLALALRRASAAARHLVWSAAVVAVLALPVLASVIPWHLPVVTVAAAPPVASIGPGHPVDPPARAAADESAGEPAPGRQPVERSTIEAFAPTAPAVTPETALFAVWLAGALLLLLRLAVGAGFLHRVARRATPLTSPDWTRPLLEGADRLGLARAPRLLMSARLPMPYASGFVRPTIVLPDSASEWDDRRRRAVLCHELAHLRRLDLVLNAVGQLACAVWWFHPLVWAAARKLRTESERACDDLVLGVGTRASEYADHLLHIVCGALRARSPAVALPMAQQHEFEGRVLAILDRHARRGQPTPRHAAALAAAALLIVIPVSALGIARAAAPADPGDARTLDTAIVHDGDAAIVAPAEVRQPTADPERSVARQPVLEPGALAAALPRQQQDTGVARVVAALLRTLGDPVDRVRRDAAYALGNLEAPTAVAGLARTVGGDRDAAVREMAAWALGQIESRAATAALGSAARGDSAEEVRATAVWALAQIEDPEAVPVLAAVLGDPAAAVRGRAAWALGAIGARPAPDALIGALGDSSPAVRLRAAWALGQIEDPAAVRGLVAALDDSDPDVRRAVFWAAARMPGDEAEPALLAALEHEDPEIRAMAARALGGGGVDPWPWPIPIPR